MSANRALTERLAGSFAPGIAVGLGSHELEALGLFLFALGALLACVPLILSIVAKRERGRHR